LTRCLPLPWGRANHCRLAFLSSHLSFESSCWSSRTIRSARTFDKKNAQKLAPYYYKYSFESGLKICDQVLIYWRRMKGAMKMSSQLMIWIACLIDSYLVANDANLADTLKYRGR
jgi:hypothetical protein